VGLPDLAVPHCTGMDFGVGMDAASLSHRGLAVTGDVKSVTLAGGISSQSFTVTRIESSRDLESKLSINAQASGGAPFAVGASARFGFSEDVKVQNKSLFMAITCTIALAGLSIEAPVLVPAAAALSDRQDVLLDQFGNMFCRGCDRGGLFVGVLQIDSSDESEAQAIESELKGTYGLFSASASANFSSIESKHSAKVYCSMYSEGGPPFNVEHPDDPAQLLQYANTWFQAMHDDPQNNAKPYTWYLSPLTVAAGPVPPDEAQVTHAQDVASYCGSQRLVVLDQLNVLNQISENPGRFDWPGTPGSPTQQEIVTAADAAQADLDLISECASNAMNHVAQAQMPADYAKSIGKNYPSLVMPNPLPNVRQAVATAYDSVGQAIAAADDLVAAVRASLPDGPVRLGFDIGMGIWQGQTLAGPGKTATRDALPAEQQGGFDEAAAFSLDWNNNTDWAAKGGAIVKADAEVATARSKGPIGLYWLGFNIGTGIFGGAAGHTSNGPGAEKIRLALQRETQQGYNDAVSFNLPHRGLPATWIGPVQ
jgi:hypothetical protein